MTTGLVVIVLLLALQLLWIFLATHFVSYAALEAARYGARDHFSTQSMQAHFQYSMRYDTTWRNSYVTFKLLRPNPEELARYTTAQQPNFAVDFPEIRLGLLAENDKKQYLQDRVMRVEVIACYPLRVAIARELLSWTGHVAHIHCQAQQVGGARLWPIRKLINVPIHTTIAV